MAIECPECGNQFSGYKCGCGYRVPYQKAEHQESSGPAMCTAYGCPMLGTISESTRPPHNWFCRFHYNEPSNKWAEITTRVRALDRHEMNTLISLPLIKSRADVHR